MVCSTTRLCCTRRMDQLKKAGIILAARRKPPKRRLPPHLAAIDAARTRHVVDATEPVAVMTGEIKRTMREVGQDAHS